MSINRKAAAKPVSGRERRALRKSPRIGAAELADPAATEPSTDSAPPSEAKSPPRGKLGVLVGLLIRPEGVTLDAMSLATGWQAHSVRGAMSGALKTARGYRISSERGDQGRVYRIVDGPET